uniref:VOC domain-containing protein n=1 Tax=Bacillus cereus HuA4-10 TaxID=1053206 RepID=J8CVB3_BACCE|nr:hypothetical protein IGC_05696 [Bacillus cereus HuA4-10]
MKYVHVGINVTDLEKSIEFYEKVFGVSPVKVKMNYAKIFNINLGNFIYVCFYANKNVNFLM